MAAVRVEQETHLRLFAGREAVLNGVTNWIDQTVEGGYLLLLGPPGQGKSALMAELAQAVVILDALDELDTGTGHGAPDTRIKFLPLALPRAVRVVLSCRPDIPLVQALRVRLTGLQERAVPPLTEVDFRLLLEKRLGAEVLQTAGTVVDIRAVFERLGGNPLFLRAAADRIAEEFRHAAAEGRPPRVDPTGLPNSYAALFWDVYNRVAERAGTRWTSAEGRHKARLLQLLCVAREPLGLDE